MKELIIEKGEEIICYVFQNGKQIDKFKIKLNCNLQPIRDNMFMNKKQLDKYLAEKHTE